MHLHLQVSSRWYIHLTLLLILLFLFIAGDVNEGTSITNQSNYSY